MGAWEQTPQSVAKSFRMSTFFDIVHQDPVLSRVKLIAEPWDLGHGGYQVGNFPLLWTEWNGRYREAVRRFWRGDGGQLSELGYRLTGSSDLYQDDGRHPAASINFVTAHDGFTLRDLASYSKKHNEANGERNRDGTDDNASDNHGVEGETDDPTIVEARARYARAMLATLILSQGVPMLTSGDELGKTQRGNNNPYCQDNALSWIDWGLGEERRELFAFVRELVALRRRHPVFRRRTFFRGERVRGAAMKDISWVREDGKEMTAASWAEPERRTLGLLLSGEGMLDRSDSGVWAVDDTFLIVLHGARAPITFTLPEGATLGLWEVLVDTSTPKIPADGRHAPGTTVAVAGRTMLVLRQPRP
jgi:glycogen operon protein